MECFQNLVHLHNFFTLLFNILLEESVLVEGSDLYDWLFLIEPSVCLLCNIQTILKW